MYQIGTFISEDPHHRFTCYVKINNNELVRCYLPSNCRIGKLFPIISKTVLLRPYKTDKYDYYLEAVKYRNTYYLIDFSRINALIFKNLNCKLLHFLKLHGSSTREKVVCNTKCDIFNEETSTVIENKAVLTCNEIAIFPNFKSTHMVDQLHKYEKLLEKGYRVYYFFIALGAYTHEVSIDHSSAYYASLNSCISKGMICKAFNIHYKNNEFKLYKEISLNL